MGHLGNNAKLRDERLVSTSFQTMLVLTKPNVITLNALTDEEMRPLTGRVVHAITGDPLHP